MCQLCFINLNNKVLNRTWAYASVFANSKKTHEDGFGISANGDFYKHEKCAWNLTDWSRYVDFITNKPVMTHVRKASLVRGNKLVDDVKYNHPFISKNLILMHNGTLLRKDPLDFPQYKSDVMVDSEIFLRVLSEIYEKNGNKLSDALEKAMDSFHGKFAFIIYEILKDKYTIVRGKTALLHYLKISTKKNNEITPIGFIINTEKDSLYNSLCMANNSLINSHGVEIGWENDDVVEALEAESIYEITKLSFEKVGELKENNEPVTTYTGSRGHTYNNNWRTENFSTDELRISRELSTFKNKWEISLEYLDLMFYFTFGTGFLSSTMEDYELFTDKIIPSLNKFARKEEKFLLKIWKEIRNEKGMGDINLTKKFNLPFPYFAIDRSEDLYSYLESNEETIKAQGETK